MGSETKSFTRSSFVKGASLGVASAAAVALLGREPRPALAAEDVAWDEECDVLVVGSGYSGRLIPIT